MESFLPSSELPFYFISNDGDLLHSYTGLFRVRGKIQHPNISLIDGPILKPFEVVIDHSLRFCFVYLDGLHVSNYPSKICHPFWT